MKEGGSKHSAQALSWHTSSGGGGAVARTKTHEVQRAVRASSYFISAGGERLRPLRGR
jgi:hypothetical protein